MSEAHATADDLTRLREPVGLLCQCGHTEDTHWDGTRDCAGFGHPCHCKRFTRPTREPRARKWNE